MERQENLDIISVDVIIAERYHPPEATDVQREQKRPKHGSLKNPSTYRCPRWETIVMVKDELTALGEVGVDPSESGVGETQWPKNPNQSRVNDSVKCFKEIKKDHDGNPSAANFPSSRALRRAVGCCGLSCKPTKMGPFCSCPLDT